MKILMTALIGGMLLLPLQAHAFSDEFKKFMTDIQSRVMLKGQKFKPEDATKCWNRFDEEILSLLARFKTEEELNKETSWTELSVTEKNKEEEELIELGAIEAKFYKLIVKSGNVWLVSLFNGMGVLPSSTLHVFKGGDAPKRLAALEEISGPWDMEKILWTTLQVQKIREGIAVAAPQFATFHLPYKKKSNRSQIVFEWNGMSLKPLFWIPEVDWHMAGGEQIAGRGDAIPVGN